MTEPTGDAVAVVTGGASGIGLAIVEQLLAADYQVVAGDTDHDRLRALEAELGPGFVGVRTDVTREDDVEALVAAAAARGPVRAGFNAAGIGEGTAVVDQRRDQWDKVLGVCLTGVMLAVKHEARAMVAQGGGGAIVTIASINSRVPARGAAAYCAAKAGVEMLTRCAALELGEDGIRVNAIAPGLVNTPMAARTGHATEEVRGQWLAHTPLGRVGEPTDIASAALYLASDAAGWVTGTTLFVDGGESLTAYPDLRGLIG